MINKEPEPEFVKLARLRECLGKEPKKQIRCLGGKLGDYEEAIRILKNEYGEEDRPGDDRILEVGSWPIVSSKNLQQLQDYRAKLRIIVGKMRTKGWQNELYGESSGTLLTLLLQKLPEGLVYAFHHWAYCKPEKLSVSQLNTWLDEYLKIQVRAKATLGTKTAEKSAESVSKRSHYTTSQSVIKCRLCNSTDHLKLGKYSKFKEVSVRRRWEIAKENNVCFKCLLLGHRGFDCRVRAVCRVDDCKKPHHSLLHEERNTESESKEDSKSQYTHSYATCGINDDEQGYALRTFR